MGGADDVQIDFHRCLRAKRGDLALCHDAQQPALQMAWHVANFVEEQGSAAGALDATAVPLAGGPSECTGTVTEQLAFDQRVWNGRAVDGHERTAGALAAVVDGAGQQLLASAGLAGQQDGDVAVEHTHQFVDVALHPQVGACQRAQAR